MKVNALTKIAMCYYLLQADKEYIKKLLYEAVRLNQNINNPLYRSQSLIDIGEILIKIGIYDEADEILSKAVKSTNNISRLSILDPNLNITKARNQQLLKIAELYVIAHNYKKAVSISRNLPNAPIITVKIAVNYAQSGNKEKAAKLLKEAQKTAVAIKDKAQKAEILAEIAEAYLLYNTPAL